MKTAVKQFCGLAKPIGTFERLFRDALESFLPNLAASLWHVREHEVVNLFVFRHLIPQFRKRKLDIGQIGVEVPLLRLPKLKTEKPPKGKYADIAVWFHSNASRSRTCRPLAHIEWKNISCLDPEKKAREQKQKHKEDIRCLKHNQTLASACYAVLTDQRNGYVKIFCTRIVNGTKATNFFAPSRCLRRAVTGDVGKILSIAAVKQAKQGSACETCSSKVLLTRFC